MFPERFGTKQGPNVFITGPGRYRKIEEKYRNTSDRFAGRNSATLQSYDQKATHMNDDHINEYERLSLQGVTWSATYGKNQNINVLIC